VKEARMGEKRRAQARRFVVVLPLLALLAAGCASGGDSEGASGGLAGAGAEGRASDEGAADLALARGGEGGATAQTGGGAPLPSLGPAIIKRAHLTIEVPDDELLDAIRDAAAVASAGGGFVLSTEVAREGGATGQVILRVPSTGFEDALAQVEELGTVESKRVSGEDVGEEFVDLEARLRNFEAQETVLLRLMDRAASVSDTVKVQRALTGVQLEVERIRGRLRFLEDQTSFGTITASFREAGVVAAESGIIGRAWRKAIDVSLNIVSGGIIAIGALVPLAVLALLLALVYRLARPRIAGRRAEEPLM
jgi:hypothetical protein